MRLALQFTILCLFTSTLFSCGKERGKSKSVPKKKGVVEEAFQKAANDYKIPERLLLAVGFHESNLSPESASVPYFQVEGSTEDHSLGFSMTETAFGLSRETLGVEHGVNGDTLELQVDAYAKWLSERVAELKGFNLVEKPSSLDQRFEWLWAVGTIHIPNDKNIRAVWVKSLMAILNEGRVWQDTRNRDLLELKPEGDQYNENKLNVQSQGLLTLQDDISDINSARRLELVTDSGSNLQNAPRRIEVIHCPLSLSTCLAMQNAAVETPVRLGAHYIVPQDNTILARPIQILDHERRVQMTSSDGTIKDVKNSVVIMLVGNSGRYVDGTRVNADPTWFTAWQLRKLGSIIKGVCSHLASRDATVDAKTCSKPEGDDGIYFHNQGVRSTYRWGDIPDYDKSIFYTYINAADANVQGDVTMELEGGKKQFEAGREIQIKAQFSTGARLIRLQRAVRCEDKQLVWDTLEADDIKNLKSWQTKVTVWDSGPNQNGRHFLRLSVFDESNKILGWSIAGFYLEKYDDQYSRPAEACSFSQR